MIDHAVLKPDAGRDELLGACELVERRRIGCLCVRPCDVSAASKQLTGSGVAVGTVIAFPHGATHRKVKIAEAKQAVSDGADELDMVINIARLLDGEIDYVRDEIATVVRAVAGRIVKVILECCYLDRDQITAACLAAKDAGAHFVKTSTGFAAHGATDQDVRFLRREVGETMGVKASGGIRTLADAMKMIRAGANRIGTSSTEQILAELG